jgi:hypothetical protein
MDGAVSQHGLNISSVPQPMVRGGEFMRSSCLDDSLVIGEDAGSGHRNDLVWEYDTRRETLTRIQTTPYGSETTSVYWYPNLRGYGYLMSVIQHPYGESDQGLSTGEDDERGYVGYFKFPALASGHWDGCEKEHRH